MIDNATLELLSRHLDGETDAHEERKLARMLETDPSLAARLEAMQRLRRSIAALAARDSAPTELDNVIDPLLREPPQPLGVRPWVRWLGAAAAVVLGITVIVEVNRGRPGAKVGSIAKSVDRVRTEPTERFALSPLPTSALPPEEQPLSATDRLLASPIAEVEVGEPAALEVLGPLEKGLRDTPDGVAVGDEGRGRKVSAPPAPATASALTTGAERPEMGADERQEDAEKKSAEEHDAGRAAGIQSWEAETPWSRAQLFVFINGQSAWREFTPSSSCKPGRYTVRIVVAGGAVREARPVGGAASAVPSQRLCAAELIRGLEIEDVADGEYPAEVVVERRGVDMDGPG